MIKPEGKYTTKLAEFASGLEFDDIPPGIVEHAKRIALNQLSTSFWGWRINAARLVYDVMNQLGGAEEASVIGAETRIAAPNAAAINASLSWVTHTDDAHSAAVIHSGHATLQTALAESEALGLSGADLITAMVAGNEVGIRIGHAVSPEQDQKYNANTLGWWTEQKNVFCAAVTSGKLLKLEADQMRQALGIAATSSSGLQWTGASAPYSGNVYAWEAGKAVHAGMLAARLAANGMTDGPEPLEGEKGWVRAYTNGHGRVEWLTEGLGTEYETGNIALKTRCSSHMVHLPIDTTYQLVNEHSIAPDQVAKVTIRGQQWLGDYLWRLDVKNYQDAIFSLPYCIALVILEPGPMTLPDQVVKYIGSPAIDELMTKCELEVDPVVQIRTQMPARITITTTDGRVVSKDSGDMARGTYPDLPLEQHEIETKFGQATEGFLDSRSKKRVIELVDQLEQLETVEELTDLLRVGARETRD